MQMTSKHLHMAAVLAFAWVSGCTVVEFPEARDATPAVEPDIDLAKYTLTFEEEFRRVDVSAWRCDTRWIAHTPWKGDFGAARFADPSRGFPFMTKKGLLRIEARNDPALGWQSGLLSARNTCDSLSKMVILKSAPCCLRETACGRHSG